MGGSVRAVFISHASADDGFVAELRRRLERLGVPVWVDSRSLRGGDQLAPEIEAAIEAASHVLVVLSLDTVNSPWVRREVDKGLEVQRARGDGYRVIPLLLPGVKPQALGLWFAEAPVAVAVQVGPGGLSAALPGVLTALGRRLPTDHQPFAKPDAGSVEELVLSLQDPTIVTGEGTRRARAMAHVTYQPARPGAGAVTSRRFELTAPLGPIEAADLRWYLESYYRWPVGVFRERAETIEARLPGWGQALHAAALDDPGAREAVSAWQRAGAGAGSERRFSVEVDADLPAGAVEDAEVLAREAAVVLLALPWELLHDGRGWLFQGRDGVRVRRRLPNRRHRPERLTELPVRILLVSPRPERDGEGRPIGYIDHRVSARPLVEAVESLGDLARLTVLQPPTYAALEQALTDGDEGRPFDVVHFDGHGVYDRRLGLGGLCFEDADDSERWAGRRMDFVDASKLAGLVRGHRVPLVFLEACQTALAEVDPTASVAAKLLEEGVTSVVAMSHSVLVETARLFVARFYAELARGARVGAAMLAGQQALFADPARGKILGVGELRLRDWFVPVLYQEQQDPQLITKIPAREAQQLQDAARALGLGGLPEAPAHRFHGRSRELLGMERLLHRQRWVVVRGTGGQGKTTLAAELAGWLVRTARFGRAGFVSLEHHRDPRAVLDTLGHQLLGTSYSVAQYPDLDQALQPVERALRDDPTIVVIDNCETVLPERLDTAPAVTPEDGDTDDAAAAILALCRRLLDADPRTRLVFTTRESLPAPFDTPAREWELGALARDDAVELVAEVMKQHGWTPPAGDLGATPGEITDLVEAVNRHPRALVLLAREVTQAGVRATTADLRTLMARLERTHPGDRENSLYASVELSLRRLTPRSRQHVRALAACHGGVHLWVIEQVTGLESDPARELAVELIDVGLGEDMGGGHLRLDPGLAPYLLAELAPEEADVLRTRWADAMAGLARYLYGESNKDARRVSGLTLLELPNLLAMLDWLNTRQPPDVLVDLAARVEQLVAGLGQPRALARAVRVREQAAQQLGGWSGAGFNAASAEIDRLLERGELPAAHTAAQRLLTRALAAGDTAYPAAAYHVARAHWRLGSVLQRGGAAQAALAPLAEAQNRFHRLSEAGNRNAELMHSGTFTEIGNCLADLGRLDEAAAAYEEHIRRAPKLGDLRGVAVAKGQLASVRRLQKRYAEALDSHAEARDTFEGLGEPRMVAVVWHQIGIVHYEAGQFEPAEHAYRESLAINVRENNLAGQASTLSQLGSLYAAMGRAEEAVTFYQQAAHIQAGSGNLADEGGTRSNLAYILHGLGRYDEARRELQRAIECQTPYGHAAQPWKTWAILENLERATGHPEEAHAARTRAIDAYLGYRRDGGDSHSNSFQLFSVVADAIRDNTEDQAAHQLHGLIKPDHPPWFITLIRQLHAILAGSRDPGLAADPALDYGDAAELILLLEALHTADPGTRQQ
ncbi:MAG: tetratricopeptide repeat protein [Actinomycetota bacterium]|nr:tetratricopeptide repeat protein [Actinomycetota bacterium]